MANPVPAVTWSGTTKFTNVVKASRSQVRQGLCVVVRSQADGQTPNSRYGIISIPLNARITKDRTDGYIFGMIRNGRNTMPSYNRIEERDRWDVVNYVRALQGLVTNVTFERGPLALPGVNGDKVPGPSTIGPNRAIPYRPSAPTAPDTARGNGGAR